MRKDSNILVTGGHGMVGKKLIDILSKRGYKNIFAPTRKKLDLSKYDLVCRYLDRNEIEYVFHLAAKVGGIVDNAANGKDYLYENAILGLNLIKACNERKTIKKVINVSSSCVYPAGCKQPMKESFLMTGRPEITNSGYAMAKLVVMELSKLSGNKFLTIIPCNIYGENDNFNLSESHVISALIKKIHQAKTKKDKSINILGTGTAERELIHVEDVASALLFFMMKNVSHREINIGTGNAYKINSMAKKMMEIMGYYCKIINDPSYPDGMRKKCVDVNIAHSYGWNHKISFEEGIRRTYNWYLSSITK